jgi:hypothetical protein|tara:strand:- start:136 stop:321 length:186 start_codon:yes stop_codon:yes gene_type:complete
MDSIDFAERLNREIEKELEKIRETYMSGSLSDMEHHKYLQGKLEALYTIQDFIKNYFNSDK